MKLSAFGACPTSRYWVTEVDDSRDLFTRPQHVEGIKPGRLNIEIHHKYATAAERERNGNVDQSHRAADAAFE